MDKKPKVDWFEAVTENYIDTEGRPIEFLENIREHYPIGLHGVSLSIGSTDPIDRHYLKKLKLLISRIDPAIVSDHLCWTRSGGIQTHDLLPMPFTSEALRHVVRRVVRVQEAIGRRILIENVSSYVSYRHSTIPEWEFLAEVAEKADCGILLDINNIYVNAINFSFDPRTYIDAMPTSRIGQYHLAGHSNRGDYLFDTHDAPVIDPVWELFRQAVDRLGPKSTLIEWDAKIPEFEVLEREAMRARVIEEEVVSNASIQGTAA